MELLLFYVGIISVVATFIYILYIKAKLDKFIEDYEYDHEKQSRLFSKIEVDYIDNRILIHRFENLRRLIIRHERENGKKRRKSANDKLSQKH